MHKKITFLFVFCVFTYLLPASSIIPFDNLEHLSNSADLIVLATASSEQTVNNAGISTFYRDFQVKNVIKGNANGDIRIASAKKIIGDYTNIIHGEYDFHKDKSYLLFLQLQEDGSYYPICLSYYVFEEVQKKGQSFLVPGYDENSLQVLKKKKERILQVYKTDDFINNLKSHVDEKRPVDIKTMVADSEDQGLTQAIKKSAPSFCSYLQTNNGLRFRVQNLDSQSLPIYYQNGQSECSSVQSEMQAAINHMNDNYDGVELALKGSVNNFNTDCAGGKAYNISYFGGNYDAYMNQQLGTSRAVLVQFGDPCNEIPALNRCSGTVAFGGSWAIGSHIANGETFNTAVYGYVIVNENMGNCNCGDVSNGSPISDFSSIIAHELSHTIGINHIASSNGNANMNPVSGTKITNLDIQCVDDLYPPSKSTDDDTDPPTNENPDTQGQADIVINQCGSVTYNSTSLTVNNLELQNTGNVAIVGSIEIKYYASINNQWDANDPYLGSKTFNGLSVNQRKTIRHTMTIPNMADGNYNIIMRVDPDDNISESGEQNNGCLISSPKLTIQSEVLMPDLSITCGSVQVNDQSVQLSNAVVRNIGNQRADSGAQYTIYVTSNAGRTNLLTRTLSSISANGTQQLNHTISTSQLNPGNYRLGIDIDTNNKLSESNENNNNCTLSNPVITIQAPEPQNADLDITSCGSLSQTGEVISASNLVVKNVGDASTSGNTFLGYYLSSNLTIDQSDYYLGYDLVKELSSGSQSVESVTINLSNYEIPDGEYYFGAIADFNTNLDESNENNNTCRKNNPKIIVGGADEEPTVTDLRMNCGSVTQHTNSIAVSGASVHNNGNQTIDSGFFVGFYLSKDRNITRQDYLLELGQDYISSIRPGQSISVNGNYSLNGIPAGEYYFGMIADHIDNIDEDDESNNNCHVTSQKITVSNNTVKPDLSVSCNNARVTSSLIDIRDVSITNDGQVSSGSYSFVGFYLSTDEKISSADYYLGYDYVSILAKGASSKEQETVNLSSLAVPDGKYYLGVLADFTDRVDEDNEQNNACTFAGLTIKIGNDSPPSNNEPEGTTNCATILNTNFENGQLGPWRDGGIHAFLNSGTTFAANGARSFALRGNEDKHSSIYLRNAINQNLQHSFRLSFNVKSYLLERGDKFVVEIDKGTGYQMIKEWEATKDFSVDKTFLASVDFESNKAFQIRIRAKTSHTYEYIFIDDITLESCQPENGLTTTPANSRSFTQTVDTSEITMYPNPVSVDQLLHLAIDIDSYTKASVRIFDSAGKLQREQSITGLSSTIELAGLVPGLYYARINLDDQIVNKKLIITE